jgi:hypothetical protein
MKNKIRFGFLMLAMITLLSGMVQAEKFVVKATDIEVSIKSPPNMLPTFDLNLSIPSFTITWLSFSMPGVQDQCSANYISEMIISADMQSMYYISNSKLIKRYYASQIQIYNNHKVNYRLPRDGLRQSWQA